MWIAAIARLGKDAIPCVLFGADVRIGMAFFPIVFIKVSNSQGGHLLRTRSCNYIIEHLHSKSNLMWRPGHASTTAWWAKTNLKVLQKYCLRTLLEIY